MQKISNIYREIPDSLEQEQFSSLLQHPGLKLERIVSRGHSSPEHGWYEQPEHEWVMLLQGEAEIEFEQGGRACA